MGTLSKSIVDPILLGAELRKRRKALGRTLKDVEKTTLIDVGQLSRFERGEMKMMSKNLQKFIASMQILDVAAPAQSTDVVRRFAVIVRRSDRHAAAASAFVSVLEDLM
jgi:transcriptional regulator with XRE-family HTH domain